MKKVVILVVIIFSLFSFSCSLYAPQYIVKNVSDEVVEAQYIYLDLNESREFADFEVDLLKNKYILTYISSFVIEIEEGLQVPLHR